MEEATYLIVNRQLQDLVRYQENMLAKANAMVSLKWQQGIVKLITINAEDGFATRLVFNLKCTLKVVSQ